MGRLIVSLLFWSLLCGLARSFTFTVNSQPGQCDPLSISWTGGQPPFRLIGVIPNGTDVNVTVPDSSFQDGKGSYTLPALQVPKSTQIFFAMSDATSPVSGGTSTLMLVGDSTSGQTCNFTIIANDFFFSADATLTQCANFPFTLYEGAKLPLTIFAWIPGGSESFVLPFDPPTATTFNWKANVTAQTQVVFEVIDSGGRRGGTDIIRLVAPSNDKSCLQTTGGGGNSTGGNGGNGGNGSGDNGGNGGNGGKGGSNTTGSSSSGSLSTGAIVGIAVGGGVVIALLALLLWYLSRKRTKNDVYGRKDVDLAEDFARHPELSQPMLASGPGMQQQYTTPDPFYQSPAVFVAPAMNSSVSSFRPEKAYQQQQQQLQQQQQFQQHQYQPQSPYGPAVPGIAPAPAPAPSTSNSSGYYDQGAPSTSGAATSASSSSRQTMFVVHRDIEEVDLPPQYVDRRPVSGFDQRPSSSPSSRKTKKG